MWHTMYRSRSYVAVDNPNKAYLMKYMATEGQADLRLRSYD